MNSQQDRLPLKMNIAQKMIKNTLIRFKIDNFVVQIYHHKENS